MPAIFNKTPPEPPRQPCSTTSAEQRKFVGECNCGDDCRSGLYSHQFQAMTSLLCSADCKKHPKLWTSAFVNLRLYLPHYAVLIGIRYSLMGGRASCRVLQSEKVDLRRITSKDNHVSSNILVVVWAAVLCGGVYPANAENINVSIKVNNIQFLL